MVPLSSAEAESAVFSLGYKDAMFIKQLLAEIRPKATPQIVINAFVDNTSDNTDTPREEGSMPVPPVPPLGWYPCTLDPLDPPHFRTPCTPPWTPCTLDPLDPPPFQGVRQFRNLPPFRTLGTRQDPPGPSGPTGPSGTLGTLWRVRLRGGFLSFWGGFPIGYVS